MPDVQSVTVDSRGGDNNLLQIVLSFFGGRRFLDIRRYFRGGEGALIPTKKGICLSLNEFQFLVTAIHANESTIASWLEQGASEAWVELNRIRIAGEAARYEAKSFIRVSRPERTATFFSIAEEGGKLKLIYNESHPLRRAMEMAQVSAGTSGDPNRLIVPSAERRPIAWGVRFIMFMFVVSFESRRVRGEPFAPSPSTPNRGGGGSLSGNRTNVENAYKPRRNATARFMQRGRARSTTRPPERAALRCTTLDLYIGRLRFPLMDPPSPRLGVGRGTETVERTNKA